MVCNLVEGEQYNGEVGEVRTPLTDGRHEVFLIELEKSVSLKPENLKCVRDDESFEVGDSVMIHGLKTAGPSASQQFNGRRGEVMSPCADGRHHVGLRATLTLNDEEFLIDVGKSVSLKPENLKRPPDPAELKVGDRVVLHNLKNGAFNGASGKLMSPCSDGRFEVKLNKDDKIYRFKPENIVHD